MPIPTIRTLLADDRGGPLAEMAVLLLPFLLIIAMVVEGGNILWRHQASLKAVRDSARYISRAPLLFDEACGLNAGVFTLAVAEAKALGATGTLQGGLPLIPGWTADNIEIPTPVVLTTVPCRVSVQATASVDLPLPFAPLFRLFDQSIGDVLTFRVADRVRWLGE